MSDVPAKKLGEGEEVPPLAKSAVPIDAAKPAPEKSDVGGEMASTKLEPERMVSAALAMVSARQQEDASARNRPPVGKESLDDLRVRFGKSVGLSYWILVFVIPILLAFLLVLLGGLIPKTETIDKLALADVLLVGLGIFLGFMSLYFGVMMTWLGIESAFSLSAKGKAVGKEAQLAFSSASPGLLFGLMGGVMVVACLYKTIEFTVKDNTSKSAQDVIDKNKENRVGPEAGIYTPPKQGEKAK